MFNTKHERFRIRNGREVPEGARYKVEQLTENSTRLTIKEIWDIDDGEYSCEASNSLGSDTSTARLRVQMPPVIERPPENHTMPAGEMYRAKIYFSGTGPFEIKLKLNGVEVRPDHQNIKVRFVHAT